MKEIRNLTLSIPYIKFTPINRYLSRDGNASVKGNCFLLQKLNYKQSKIPKHYKIQEPIIFFSLWYRQDIKSFIILYALTNII